MSDRPDSLLKEFPEGSPVNLSFVKCVTYHVPGIDPQQTAQTLASEVFAKTQRMYKKDFIRWSFNMLGCHRIEHCARVNIEIYRNSELALIESDHHFAGCFNATQDLRNCRIDQKSKRSQV